MFLFGVILVLIFTQWDWIRTRITRNTDTFYVVSHLYFFNLSFLPWIELCIFEIVAYIFNMPSIWLTMLIGTSFEINLETLGRRITCSTSIHGFAIFFFFVICEGSIWLDPRFNGGKATWIIFSEFSWITVMSSFFVQI